MDINEACQKLPAPSSSKQLVEVFMMHTGQQSQQGNDGKGGSF